MLYKRSHGPSEAISYLQELQKDNVMKALRKLVSQGGQIYALASMSVCEPVMVLLVMPKFKQYCLCEKNSITCAQLLISIPALSFPTVLFLQAVICIFLAELALCFLECHSWAFAFLQMLQCREGIARSSPASMAHHLGVGIQHAKALG